MMLVNDDIRTVLVTIHVSLRQAIEAADFEAQMRAITWRIRPASLNAHPRIGVAGLNPHAGKAACSAGEIDIISPAIKTAQAKGINAQALGQGYGFHGRAPRKI